MQYLNAKSAKLIDIDSAVILNHVKTEYKSCLGGHGLGIYWPHKLELGPSTEGSDYTRTPFAKESMGRVLLFKFLT